MTRSSPADPFTIAVIQAGFESAAAEMFDTLRKTAMSPIIYEVFDAGTGTLDADGALVSSGAGIPGFVGVLDKAIKAILAQERAPIVEGDIFILNDPNFGGVTHLNDVVLAEPVFHKGIRVAWVASIAHWGDIGGSTPGSMAVGVTEIFAEGLRLPPVRLYSSGQRNDAVHRIIETNSRLPEFVLGDLAAQLAAGRKGAAVIRELYDRYGPKNVSLAIQAAFCEGNSRAYQGLAKLPKGRFPIEAVQDDGSLWKLFIDITDERFVVDLRAAPDALASPHNTSRDGTLVVCQMLFKTLTDAHRFANDGSFAPLEVRTRPGSIFHAGSTDPQGYYFETRIRLFDQLWRAMATAMPGRLPAGHFATIFGTVIAGSHPVTGRNYTMVEPQMGGWGATATRNGTGPLFSSSHGDTYNCPVEVAEARYGLEVVEKRLNFGPRLGKAFQGGPGVITRYRMTAPALLSAGISHTREPVWALANGEEGGKNKLTIIRRDKTEMKKEFVSGFPLEKGDEVEIVTAYGGGAKFGGA